MSKKNFLKPELIATTKRANTVETLHYGWICVINKEKKVIYKRGRISDQIFLRSSAKPIQAIPVINYDINITPKELAIICGSHSGSKLHINLLTNFMKKHKFQVSNLKCGAHLPFDEKEKTRLVKKNISPNPLHNNCSGKHLGMLAVCKKNKWDLKSYLNPNHPIQKNILKKIKELSGTKNISIAVDGCGVPTFSLPVINIAKMFSSFTHPKNKRYLKIISAISKNPFYLGSNNQIDTEIIKASKGKLIAKVGAEGIIIIASKGNCIVVKIADGSPKIRSIVALKLLIRFNWLKKSQIKNLFLREILKGEIRNHVSKVVGKIVTCF